MATTRKQQIAIIGLSNHTIFQCVINIFWLLQKYILLQNPYKIR